MERHEDNRRPSIICVVSFDIGDIVLKGLNTNRTLKGKHKVCSILDIVYFALSGSKPWGEHEPSLRR